VVTRGVGWSTLLAAMAGALRAAFGVIWAIDAYLAWQPEFAAHYVGYLTNAQQGQPGWLQPWFAIWLTIVNPAADVFIFLTRVIETLIAVGLLFGLARKWISVAGSVLSLLIWATAEGFGGPYTVGATNPGPGLVYVIVFLALILIDRAHGRTPYSLDHYIQRRWPRWSRVAEWAPASALAEVPPPLPWSEQAVAIVAIVVAIVVPVGSLQSALNVSPATPASAAAAVSPLSLASSTAIAQARDATLPPLIGTGDSVSLTITSTDTNVEIANGVSYAAWTYDGTVPGPVLHVRQGQTVNVTYVNRGIMQHSIDFHAAEVPPNVAYRSINPGDSLQFSFVARTAGVFVYHCGTPPVLMHMANGMYGAIVVDPVPALPPADVSYVLVQSEWYTQQLQGSLLTGDPGKMFTVSPDEVVFNGMAYQYRDQPLTARAGERIRLYVVDAGPNLSSAFHVIGSMFETVYPDGDAAHALNGVSTWQIAPGAGAIFDLVIRDAGQYPFVDHSMRNMGIGAVGVLNVQ